MLLLLQGAGHHGELLFVLLHFGVVAGQSINVLPVRLLERRCELLLVLGIRLLSFSEVLFKFLDACFKFGLFRLVLGLFALHGLVALFYQVGLLS